VDRQASRRVVEGPDVLRLPRFNSVGQAQLDSTVARALTETMLSADSLRASLIAADLDCTLVASTLSRFEWWEMNLQIEHSLSCGS